MTSCVWTSSVKTSGVMRSGGRRRREEEAEEADGMQEPKTRTPHKDAGKKRIKSPGCLLDSGISKVPCVLSVVRVRTFQISHVQPRLRV